MRVTVLFLAAALGCAAVLAPAAPARAGPWLRDPGEAFLSFGGNVALTEATERPVHYDPEVFLEYGVTKRLTLGVDGYLADAARERTVMAFAAIPLRGPEGGDPVTLSLALGQRLTEGRTAPVARIGLAAGRSLPNGWLSAEAALIRARGAEGPEPKLDLTWGRDLTPRLTGVVQLQTGIGTSGDFYAKIAPSAVWKINDRLRLRAGAVRALTGDNGMGLHVGTWWRF